MQRYRAAQHDEMQNLPFGMHISLERRGGMKPFARALSHKISRIQTAANVARGRLQTPGDRT